MIHNQLARRNLTNDEMAYLWGKRYLGEKKEHGDRGPEKMGHSDPSSRTSEAIAQELGVGEATVRRAASFAEAVDIIAKICGPEAKDLILSGELALTRSDVVAIAEEDPKTVKAINHSFELFVNGSAA